jgi:hypothetical protein
MVGLAAGVALSSGCGVSHPPFAADPDPTPTRPGNTFDFDASTPVPDCTLVRPDGTVCGCTDLPIVVETPNLYFVLDRSGSMAENNKWTTVRNVVAQVVKSIGPRAAFGVAIFPSANIDGCAPGLEVLAPRRGDNPPGYAGKTTTAILDTTNVPASGGTPTSSTLRALTPRIGGLGGKTAVILATDGGPNCNDNATCDVSTCIPNIESASAGCSPAGPANCCDPQIYGPGSCLDGPATVTAVQSLHDQGVDTYVVGVPGSGPYASLLDQVATAGGTARAAEPLYFAVSTTDEAALLTALSEIAAKVIATCTLSLASPPADPGLVNVYLDQKPVPPDPVNGWTLDGATVTLVGDTCNRVMTGLVLDVRVVAGCPTVPPK